jgi:hypothetical protein
MVVIRKPNFVIFTATGASPTGKFMYKLNKLLFLASHCDRFKTINEITYIYVNYA